MFFRPLPWEYGVRNLFRRPLRTFLTFLGLTTVVLLVLVVVGFIRGLEKSLSVSGNSQTALIFSLGMGENLEYSSIPMRTNDLVPSSIQGIQERYGSKYVSPELYLGTQVGIQGNSKDEYQETLGLVRGVTPNACLVRQQFQLDQGRWPEAGEIIIGRLAATKLGATSDDISIGDTLQLESRDWKIVGVFSCGVFVL